VSYPPEQVIADMILRIRAEERNAEHERIIKLLDENHLTAASELIEQDALSRGENKANPWTSRPLTEEDVEHYGLERENK